MAFLGQEEQLRELQERFRYLYTVLFITLGILTARLVYLQIFNGDKMRQYSEENRIKKVLIASPRGMIFDRNKKIILDNNPSFDLEITPQYLKESKQKDKVIKKVAELLNLPEEKIYKKLKRARHQQSFLPVKIRTNLSRNEVAKIETWKLSLPGVAIKTEIERFYPDGETSSHLLGYVGKINAVELERRKDKRYKLRDIIGKTGIEKKYETILKGKDGQETVEVDALGRKILDQKRARIFEIAPEDPAIPGKNLVLTIDKELQAVAHKAFGETIGSLVAMDPQTGEILAMISKPSFDPTGFSREIPTKTWNKLLNNPHHPLRDKTIQDHYSPGSVFKVITAITALEENIINENTTFNCPGRMRLGRKIYHCHKKHGHGTVDLNKAIAQSCDVFFYKLALRLKSVDLIAKWAQKFGLGTKTGIELPREIPGLIPTEKWKQKRLNKPWVKGETLSVAIGQSYVLTSVLQLANMYSTIANGGKVFKPYVLKRIENENGKKIKEFEPQLLSEVVFSSKTLEIIKKGLWSVVNEEGGTAYRQKLPEQYSFAGKTGTSQVIRLSKDKIYQKCKSMKYKNRHHAVFTGFAPSSDPKIVVAVLGEHACHGSTGAAPIAKTVIEAYLKDKIPNNESIKIVSHYKKDSL